MTDADACFEEGMKHIGLSRHADYRSEYVGDLKDAIACFDRALALKPDHADALSEKGTALAALGRDAEAAETLARAIHLRPEIAQLWLERAGSLQRLGRYEEAIASCNETLRRRPDDADAMFCRAESLDALKQDAEALPAWDEVLGKGDLRTMSFHGRPVRMLGSDYRRLRALLARAGALARLGRTTDAIDAYQKSIDEGASRDNSVSDMFSAALAAQEAARTAYQTYIESHGDEPAVWRDAGSNFNRAGMTSDALAAYEQAIRLAPGNPDGWIGKAEVLVKSGRRTESLEAFREALRVKPGYLAASLRLARVQKEIGRGQSDAKGPGVTQAVDDMFAEADAEDEADLAEAEREAAATGKEPFSYARLEELLGAEPPEIEKLTRLQYYVRYSEMRTLAELADKLRELARWA